MKVFLADLVHSYSPAQGTGSYSGGNEAGFVVPLGIASIGVYAKKIFGKEVDISLFKFPNDFLEACDNSTDTPPDVIGFSNYVWNTHLNFSIGSMLRARFPHALIVAGGPSVQADENGIKTYLLQNKFIDVCIIHEGERPFAEILKEFKTSGKSFIRESRSIDGVGFLTSGDHLNYSPNGNSGDMDELPSPYTSGYLDEFMSKGFIPMLETNRGCPFGCTYCAWGIAALQKVRKYSIDRIYDDMEYISEKMPLASTWFIADANFGILKRDVEIAQRISHIKSRNPSLKTIVMYESKNTPARNYEVAQLLRNQDSAKSHRMDNALIALQTLDEAAQIATNRKNIKLLDVAESVATYHAEGYGVRTDILSGLPGETHEGHLNTLRDVFNFDFDQIGIYNVILLPGTEMASSQSRKNHDLYTKYFTRDGYFGEYQGVRSIEAEEVVCGNSAISPDDLMNLRLLHWAIWFGWNHKFLKPLLKYANSVHKKNPVDVLYSMINGKPMRTFFDGLKADYSVEFFDSAENLQAHYLQDCEWNAFLGATKKPAHLLYNAKLIQNRSLYEAMLNALRDIIVEGMDFTDCDDIFRILMSMRIDPEEVYQGKTNKTAQVTLPSHLADYFDIEKDEFRDAGSAAILHKPHGELTDIRNELHRYNFDKEPLTAICSTVGNIAHAFTYNLVEDKLGAETEVSAIY